MEKEILAMVKSPARYSHLRKGNGFSRSEVKEAGKTVNQLKKLNVKIDYLRKSTHEFNVEVLKKIKISPAKKEERQPFKHKEKKKRVRVKKIRKQTPEKEELETQEKVKTKAEPKVKIKPKVDTEPKEKDETKTKIKPTTKKEPIKKEKEEKKKKEAPKKTGLALTELSGLGPATAKKLEEVGVENVETLCSENPKELALLVKGVSEEKLTKWMEEGKTMLNK